MLATLNLQLVTADLNGESLPLQSFVPKAGVTQIAGFAELLNLRVDSLQQQPVLDGQILPEVGNKLPLPEPDIAITVDDLPVTNLPVTNLPVPDATVSTVPEIAAGLTTEIDEFDELPDGELPRVEIPATDEPAVTTTLPVVIPGPVTPALPVAEAVLADNSATGRIAEQYRDVLSDSRQLPRVEVSVQQVEARVIGTGERPAPLAPPGPVADRQPLATRQATAEVTSDDDIDRLVETTGRQPAAPVAAPVVERITEAMRARVRSGQSVTAATVHTQPAGFQPLPSTNALSETGFASTLQQQASDLIRTLVTDPAWGDRIGERVVMLAGNQLKSAEIRLTPAELGPVRVQVSVEDGATNVTFQAAHAVTRDALEQALPRLREMLAESGLTLGQADVGDQGVAQGERDGDTESAAAGIAGEDSSGQTVDTDQENRHETLVPNGLVDTFA